MSEAAAVGSLEFVEGCWRDDRELARPEAPSWTRGLYRSVRVVCCQVKRCTCSEELDGRDAGFGGPFYRYLDGFASVRNAAARTNGASLGRSPNKCSYPSDELRAFSGHGSRAADVRAGGEGRNPASSADIDTSTDRLLSTGTACQAMSVRRVSHATRPAIGSQKGAREKESRGKAARRIRRCGRARWGGWWLSPMARASMGLGKMCAPCVSEARVWWMTPGAVLVFGSGMRRASRRGIGWRGCGVMRKMLRAGLSGMVFCRGLIRTG